VSDRVRAVRPASPYMIPERPSPRGQSPAPTVLKAVTAAGERYQLKSGVPFVAPRSMTITSVWAGDLSVWVSSLPLCATTGDVITITLD
jgi:hypothetical protein